MKRFISLFAVVALVVAMAVPAMAVQQFDFPDVLSVWDSDTYPYAVVIEQSNGYALVLYTELGYYKEYSSGSSHLNVEAGYENYKLVDGVWTFNGSTPLGGYSGGFDCLRAVWSSADLYDVYGNLTFEGSSVPQFCDGSACPATDENHDDICDDCGLPMAFSLRDDTTYDYNGFVLPVLPVLDYDAYWVMFPSGDTAYRLVASSKPFSVENGEVYVYEQTSLVFFSAGYSSNEWSQYSTQNITTKYSVGDAESIVWASHNIANKETGDVVFNGDVNFRDPLWVEMEQVTQGEMMGLTQTMGGTMKTLVVCGVGLMACLVALSLFGKRSLIFRS